MKRFSIFITIDLSNLVIKKKRCFCRILFVTDPKEKLTGFNIF